MDEAKKAKVQDIIKATLEFCGRSNVSPNKLMIAVITMMASDFQERFSREAAANFMQRGYALVEKHPMVDERKPTIEEVADFACDLSKFWTTLSVTNNDIDSTRYVLLSMLWRQYYGDSAREEWQRLVADWTNHWNLRHIQ